MSQSDTSNTLTNRSGGETPTAPAPAAQNKAKAANAAKAAQESQEETVTEPGGFKNDPDDATNPNEVIERSRRKLRP